jgi:hypothetical protein
MRNLVIATSMLSASLWPSRRGSPRKPVLASAWALVRAPRPALARTVELMFERAAQRQ